MFELIEGDKVRITQDDMEIVVDLKDLLDFAKTIPTTKNNFSTPDFSRSVFLKNGFSPDEQDIR